MEQDIKQEIPEIPEVSFVWTLVGIAVVTAGIVGGGVFWWQRRAGEKMKNEAVNAARQEMQAQIDDLRKQVETLQKIGENEQKVGIFPVKDDPNTKCELISGLDSFQFCKSKQEYNYILGPNLIEIMNVGKYSVSPNKKLMLVVRFSDDYIRDPGAPTENGLVMVDIENNKIYDIFPQIYFPNFVDSKSWDSNGIVFTAGGPSAPDVLGETNLYAVVYCKITECKVLASDAGPEGIGGDPAFFEDGQIIYTDIQGKKVSLPSNL